MPGAEEEVPGDDSPSSRSMIRRAVALAGLAQMILVPSTGAAVRSEFFRVIVYTLDGPGDIRGMADARVRTNRYLLKWGWVQPNQGSFDWGPTDRSIGR